MLDQQQNIAQRPVLVESKKHMLWIARLLSLGPSVLVSLLIIRNLITLWSVSTQESSYYMYLFFLTLIPGIVAWWWHRIGGILLILMSVAIIGAIIYVFVALGFEWDMGAAMAFWLIGPFVVATSWGGILHIKYWYKEKKPLLNQA